MKKLLLAAAILAMAPAAAFAADQSGTWLINAAFDSMGIKYVATCVLKDDGTGKLSGPCHIDMGDPSAASDPVATGSVSGTAFDLAYDTTYQGTPVHLDYKGAVGSDGTVTGTIDTGGPQGTFTASKK
ncbi:MAG TPA: hypothetical protein VMU37_01645 [Caulobacteraceae bacterium]|nr:hypothetical protein [Caulobacteraceae bacterium]